MVDVPTEFTAGQHVVWRKTSEPFPVPWFPTLEAEDLSAPEIFGGLIGELIEGGGRWYGVARAPDDRPDEALVAVASDDRREAYAALFESAKAWASHAHRHASKRLLAPRDRFTRTGDRDWRGGIVTQVRDDGYPELDGVWTYFEPARA